MGFLSMFRILFRDPADKRNSVAWIIRMAVLMFVGVLIQDVALRLGASLGVSGYIGSICGWLTWPVTGYALHRARLN